MKLHIRILLVVALCIIGVQVPSYIVYRLWIVRSFGELETRSATENMERCRSLLETDLNHLAVTVEDWASWDSTWNFVQDRNEGYVAENLGIDPFMSLQINLMHIADARGNLVYSAFYSEADKKLGRPSSLALFSGGTMSKDSPFFLHFKEQMVRGIYPSEKGLLLIVARPVLHSDDSGPVVGTFVMGKLIDREYMESINSRIRLPVELMVGEKVPGILEPNSKSEKSRDIHLAIRDEKTLAADLVLRDLRQNPVGMIRAKIGRALMERGRETYRFFLGAMVATGVVLLVLIHLFLYLTVVRRIKRLSKFVSVIDDPSIVMEQKAADGTDEIGTLAAAFDTMMVRLDRSGQKKQMESLLALSGGVAHDLNNILGPAVALPGVVIEELRETAEAHQLDIRGILEDLELISLANRRAALVVNDLSIMSSMGRIRKEPIVPRAIVKDILRSAAVAEALSAKNGVEVFQELTAQRRILGAEGPLSRLVLNLIINAIDAVDGAGAITVSVEDVFLKTPPFPISDFDVGDYVVLKVSDTGNGIDALDLAHIFEPFFTRKLGFGRRGAVSALPL